MSRSLSTTAKQAIFRAQTSEAFIVLLTISHASITTLRFASNSEDVTSTVEGGSNTYTAFPFSISLPDDSEDSLPSVRLAIDNVDRRMIDEIRSTLTGAPTITLWVVLASTPNTIERGPDAFTVREVTYDALTIEADLVYEDILNLQFPGDSFNPNNFPGLF